MSMNFTASRSASEDLGVPVTISFGVGGTASFSTDYTVSGATSFAATSGSLTIPVGQTSASLTVTPVPDVIVEANETIVLSPQAVAGTWAVGTGLPWRGTILNDDTAASYAYSVPAFANTEPIPKGIIYLLGSENDTIVFANPAIAKVQQYYRTGDGVYQDVNNTDFANRIVDLSVTVRTVMLDFKTNTVRAGQVGINTTSSGSNQMQWYGSNTATGLNYANTSNASLWTNLGSVVGYSPGWVLLNTANTTAWRYFKLEMSSFPDFQFGEIEFYDATIYSPSFNLM
jgi:hypothetical protein